MHCVFGAQHRRRPDLIRPGVGVRRNQDAVNYAEQRDARPDSQHQREERYRSEAGILPEGAQREARILPQPLGPQPSPRFARLVAGQGDAAELLHRCLPSFERRHARLDILLRFQVDVRLHLVL